MAYVDGIAPARAATESTSGTVALRQRWHLLVAAGMVMLCGVIRLPVQDGDSWFYFDRAARGLFGHDGFHVFARHPELQFGPAAIAVSEVFRLVGGGHTLLMVEV